MAWRARLVVGIALLAGAALGCAGCSVEWDLDPDDEVLYEGAYVDAVTICAKNTFSFRDVTDYLGVYSSAHDIAVRADATSGRFTITGTTTLHVSGAPDVERDWICELAASAIPNGAPTLTQFGLREATR